MIQKLIVTLLILTSLNMNIWAQPSSGRIATPSEVDWPQKGEVVESKPILALKTNLLFDVVSLLNIEAEVPLWSNWSVAAEWIFPWWLGRKDQMCIELLAGELQGRYWFEPHNPQTPMIGWFVGGYCSGGYYDLELSYKGYHGEFWGGGICGGYAHELRPRLRIEYAVGVGGTHNKYDRYDVVLDCQDQTRLLRNKRGVYNWWGVTKVEVSLVWVLNKNKRETK
ncbi:MAG: DUF3575 domain-containing protein [Rikenellaceae bacterium]